MLVNNFGINSQKLTNMKRVNTGGIPMSQEFSAHQSTYLLVCTQFVSSTNLYWLQYEDVFNPHRPKVKSSKLNFERLPSPHVKVSETAL